ncbi:MAG TPA: hypothetical protein VKR54_01880 [Candidatus Babeliales bacterium]|jgi:hypothetical protein|nr:hypothetical protein [Candidatus Babeliales bacterium]
MNRVVLKISIIPLVFFGNVTMGCDYNNKEFAAKLIILKPDRLKNLPSDITEDLIDYLDNPIVFGQTDKENHGLVKQQGWRNIRLAYQNKDPNFFLSHYVPVLYVDRSRSRNRLNGLFISPYRILFDAQLDQQGYRKKIVELEKKRVDYAIEEQERRLSCTYLSYAGWIFIHDCLVRVTLFGSDEDISKELSRKIYGNYHIAPAIQACIKYPNKTNNALALLSSAITVEHFDDIWKGESFYELLLLADKLKNKDAFAFLAFNDPYKEKNLIWGQLVDDEWLLFDGDRITGTNLDHMLREGNFDQENIKIYIKHGGKTMQEIREEEMQALAEEQRQKVQRKESQKDKGCALF